MKCNCAVCMHVCACVCGVSKSCPWEMGILGQVTERSVGVLEKTLVVGVYDLLHDACCRGCLPVLTINGCGCQVRYGGRRK